MKISAWFWGLFWGVSVIISAGCGGLDTPIGQLPPTHGGKCSKPTLVAPAPDGCNDCVCGADGTWACTQKACGKVCEPGSVKPAGDGCNTCACDSTGQGWDC